MSDVKLIESMDRPIYIGTVDGKHTTMHGLIERLAALEAELAALRGATIGILGGHNGKVLEKVSDL